MDRKSAGVAEAIQHIAVFGKLAYAATVLLVIFAGLGAAALSVCLTLPLAVKLMRAVKNKEAAAENDFAAIDAATAKFHTVFSLLFLVSLFF